MTFEELADLMRDVDRSRRIVVCPVGLGLKVETLVLRHNMDHLWRVQESRQCENKILLINEPNVRLL
jgi:hypothetical protein